MTLPPLLLQTYASYRAFWLPAGQDIDLWWVILMASAQLSDALISHILPALDELHTPIDNPGLATGSLALLIGTVTLCTCLFMPQPLPSHSWLAVLIGGGTFALVWLLLKVLSFLSRAAY